MLMVCFNTIVRTASIRASISIFGSRLFLYSQSELLAPQHWLKTLTFQFVRAPNCSKVVDVIVWVVCGPSDKVAAPAMVNRKWLNVWWRDTGARWPWLIDRRPECKRKNKKNVGSCDPSGWSQEWIKNGNSVSFSSCLPLMYFLPVTVFHSNPNHSEQEAPAASHSGMSVL